MTSTIHGCCMEFQWNCQGRQSRTRHRQSRICKSTCRSPHGTCPPHCKAESWGGTENNRCTERCSPSLPILSHNCRFLRPSMCRDCSKERQRAQGTQCCSLPLCSHFGRDNDQNLEPPQGRFRDWSKGYLCRQDKVRRSGRRCTSGNSNTLLFGCTSPHKNPARSTDRSPRSRSRERCTRCRSRWSDTGGCMSCSHTKGHTRCTHPPSNIHRSHWRHTCTPQ